jgi:hypothetical protein
VIFIKPVNWVLQKLLKLSKIIVAENRLLVTFIQKHFRDLLLRTNRHFIIK